MEDVLAAPVRELLDEVAAPDASPGSGALAGVSVALAAAAVTSAARASAGSWLDARAAAAQGQALRWRVERLTADNVRAYGAARRLLDAPESERAGLGVALVRAGAVPLQLAEAASDVTLLAAEVASRGNPARRDDVVAASFLAAAGARATARLVAANLTAAPDDPRVRRADALAREAAAAADAAGAAT